MDVLAHQLYSISHFGNSVVMLLLGFSLLILFLVRQEHYKTGLVAAMTSLAYVYSFYLKKLFGIPRPYGADPSQYFKFDTLGFPSGHTLFYTTFWGFVIYLSYKYNKDAKLILNIVRMAAIYMIISVGASRIYIGVHSLKDVIAGYLFGFLFLASLIWLDKKLEEVLPENKKK